MSNPARMKMNLTVSLKFKSMKRLAILFLCLSATFGYAQKANIQSAYNYLKYDQLDKAKEAIDAAVTTESTMNSDKAWYYRGLVYEKLYKHEKFGKLDPNPLKVAFDSYSKALALAPKGDFTDDINARLKAVAVSYMSKGIEDFNAKNYSEAVASFETSLKIIPNDTNILFNAGLAADKGGNYEKAVSYYTKVNEWNPKDQKVYALLVNVLKAKGDTAKAIEVIHTGRKNFPDDLNLLLSEINIYLMQGKSKEVIDLLKEAITKDPKNESLHFALGTTYDNLGGSKNAVRTAETDDYLALAETAYKKAIELKPDYFEANYNLGALYFNQGAEIANKANKLPISAQKEFSEAQKKFKEKFGQAQPYFEKALEINPNDSGTLLSLRELYAKTGQLEKSAEMKKRYQALEKK